MPGTSLESAPPGSRRIFIERLWIWTIVGYSLLRFVVAWGSFGDHGVNPWIFGLIDVGTAWPYAKSTARTAQTAWDRNWPAFVGWALVAVVTFFAPYAYLWFASDEMPASLRTALIIVTATLFVAASFGVVRRIVKGPM